MANSSSAPRLTDIIEAIEHDRSEMVGMSIDACEVDGRERWLIARGLEIKSTVVRVGSLFMPDLATEF